jgi:cell wall-associated NlpC family hydrolase
MRVLAAGLAVAVVGGVLVAAPAATAEPTKSIAEVQAELDALETQAESAQEAFNGAQVKLGAIHRKEAAAKGQVATAKKALTAQQRAIGDIVSSAYRAGGIDASVQLLMADNPQDFLRQATAVEQLAATQNAALRKTQSARLALAQATAVLTQQEASATEVLSQMKQHKAEVDASVASTQKLLDSLKAEERARLAALAAAKKAAEARAAAAAQARIDAANRAAEVARSNRSTRHSSSSGSSSSGSSSSSSSSSSGGGGGAGYSSSRAQIAVEYALAQVGKPYSYDAQPPSSWDCSKLTAAAWGRAGVSLTAYSYDQANEVRRISTSDLRPGDILFYFNNAHHVAMYIGGGQLVEAASPTYGVRVADAWNSWSSNHFSFAGRPVG